MRPHRGLVLWALVFGSACAPHTAPSAPSAPPVPPQVRMATADDLVRAGCLDCLEQAFREYTSLRMHPVVGSRATEAAYRVAILIAVRENDLGLIDSGHLRRARELVPSPSHTQQVLIDAGEALSLKPAGVARSGVSDAETAALGRIARNQLEWAAALRTAMPTDLVADYLWIGLACGPSGFSIPDRAERGTVLGDEAQTPLLAFKIGSTCSIARTPLQTVLDQDPRFHEANFFLGLAALSGQVRPGRPPGLPDLDEADARFQAAYEWRQNWPSLTMSIANVALSNEDFVRALEYFDKTLVLLPETPDALLGTVRALTYLQRHTDAIATTDRLLATNRSPGEARYWRALNEEQLQQHDQAWDDIERAAAALVNADVPKLAGIIAINRHELDTARRRLELSLSRRATDCETTYYLEVVLAEQRQWEDAGRVAANAAVCFDAELKRLAEDIATIRASDMPDDRKARLTARREQQIAADTRMRSTSWFNAAASNFNLARYDEARRFAEKLVEDSLFSDRARQLLSRLAQP